MNTTAADRYMAALRDQGFDTRASGHGPLTPGEIRLLRDVLNTPESDWQVEVADERGYWWLWLLIGVVVGGLIVLAVMR